MAEKTLNTRLKLKIDTYENWTTNDPVLLTGEVAFATVSVVQEGAVNTVPSVLAKVGDGVHRFSELGWLYARASDVASWAKAANPPTVNATDVIGMGDFISNYVEETLGITVDTNDVFRITKVDNYNYKLQTKAKTDADTAWTDVEGSTIVIPNDTATITALQNLVGDTAVVTQIGNAIADLDVADTAVSGQYVSAVSETDGKIAVTRADLPDFVGLENKVTTLIGTDSDKSVRTIANEELATQLIPETAKESLDTLQEIAAWIQSHPEDASAMAEDIAKLQTLVGDTSVSSQITVEANRAKAAEEANANAIATLNGTGNGSVAKAVSDAVSALNSSVTATAEVDNQVSVLTGVIETDGKLTDKAEVKLAAIAKTGNVNDLIQADGDVLIFDCGSSSVNL